MAEANSASLSGLLRMALVSGPPALVLTHLRRGADVNARDVGGVTPLMLAMARGRADICQLLLDEGADPRLLDQAGRSALAYAQQGAAWTAGLKFSSSNDETAPEPGVREPDSQFRASDVSAALIEVAGDDSGLEEFDHRGGNRKRSALHPPTTRRCAKPLPGFRRRSRAIG